MTAARLKALIALILMVLSFAGASAWRPHIHMSDSRPKIDLETLFPKVIGPWVIDEHMPVQLVSPDTQALLNKIYNQTLSRSYVNQPTGERIMLSVAYGGDQSDGTRAHRPDVCYPAQGFEILSGQQAQLTVGSRQLRVRQMLAKLGGRIEPVTYWFVVGDRVTVTGTEQKLAQLSYGMRGVIPDGMLVRVSNIDANAAKAYRLQHQFIATLLDAVGPQARTRIAGVDGAL